MALNNQPYEVKLDLFEGPLDLLLYLVTKAEVNIVDISVSEITTQYLSYLDLMRDLNIDVAAEYLHMAATLTYLKARELLPPGEAETVDQAEEGIYNREELVKQLLEYQKFKQAAGALKNFEAEQIGLFKRGAAETIEAAPDGDDGIDLGSLSIFDLLTAFRRVIERAQQEEAGRHVVRIDNVKIDDRIEHVLAVLTDRIEVRFEELFDDDLRKIVIVVTFMAILELVKMHEITFRQEERFGSIVVLREKKSGEAEMNEQNKNPESSPSATLGNHSQEPEGNR
jgi:segregation and condensation protein A